MENKLETALTEEQYMAVLKKHAKAYLRRMPIIEPHFFRPIVRALITNSFPSTIRDIIRLRAHENPKHDEKADAERAFEIIMQDMELMLLDISCPINKVI